MLKLYSCLVACCFIFQLHAQFVIDATGSPFLIDFTGFTGAGFQPGGGIGMLNSDEWSATGFSDGDLDFGGTATTGDFARGVTGGLETTGGIYGVDLAGNQGLFVQPVDGDFTPGNFILKIVNNTGVNIGSFDLSYTLYVLNDAGRANSFNFSISYDNLTYSHVDELDYTSPEAADFTPYVEYKTATIPGIYLADGAEFYLRWTGDDVSGSGTRDEFALDDISITAYELGDIPLVTVSPSELTVDENVGGVTTTVEISAITDCTVHVDYDAASTLDIAETDFAPFDIEFMPGGPGGIDLLVDILEDLVDEPDEVMILNMNIISGVCALGIPSTFTVTVTDNDEPAGPTYTVYDIADVTTEDANGVADSIGVLADLTGIVYGVNLWDDGLQFTIIDETGGISVYNFDQDFGYTVLEGDEVEVRGTINQFNGLTEIVADTIIRNSFGNSLKTPNVVFNLDESTESDFVQVNLLGFTIIDPSQWLGDGTSFNVTVSNGTDTYVLRIDNNTEIASMPFESIFYGGDYPNDGFQVVGVGSQYDPDAPYNAGYELIPRYVSDFMVFYEGIDELDPFNISIYPNPTSDQLIFSGKENIQSIEIINQLGETIQIISVNDFSKTISVDALPPGIYFLKITTDSGIYSSNFIRQ